MKVVGFILQVQLQLEDGSTVTFATAPMAPVNDEMNEDKIRATMLSMGTTPKSMFGKSSDELELPTRNRQRGGPKIFTP